MNNTFQLVKSAIIQVLKTMSIFTSQRTAIFEISNLEMNSASLGISKTSDSSNKNQIARQKLMLICFSPLSAWILFVALLLMYFNPFRYVASFSHIDFLNVFVSDVLFSTDVRVIFLTGFILFLISFLLGVVIQIEFVFLGLLGFLISNGDLHLRNALLFIPLIILGRLMLHLKLLFPLKNFWPFKQILLRKEDQLLLRHDYQTLNVETKKIWSIICALLFSAWIMSTWLVLNSFQFLSDQGVFSASMHFLRFEVFVATVFTYYFFELFILSIWGHFHSLKLR